MTVRPSQIKEIKDWQMPFARSGLRFLIYLTRWSFLLETLYILLAVYVTVKARAASKRPSSGDDSNSFRELYKLPRSVRTSRGLCPAAVWPSSGLFRELDSGAGHGTSLEPNLSNLHLGVPCLLDSHQPHLGHEDAAGLCFLSACRICAVCSCEPLPS